MSKKYKIENNIPVKKINKHRRNQQDSTLRNIRAADKRFDKLDSEIKELQRHNIERRINERRSEADKINKITEVLKLSGADSASQVKALSQIREILGW